MWFDIGIQTIQAWVLGAVGPGRLRGFKLSSGRYGDSARVQVHQPWL